MRRLLLVDYSNAMYRALFMNSNLSFGKKFTGGLFGFVTSMARIISDYDCDDVIVCHDRKPYLRKQHHDVYKSDRNPSANPDTVKKVKDSDELLAIFLQLSGIPQLKVAGFEADDLIALCVDQVGHEYDEVHILSNDSDLYQLFRHEHLIFHKLKGKLYTFEDYQYEYPNLKPHELVYMTALAGGHNGVPGIKGVGPVTTTKLIEECKLSGSKLKTIFKRYKGGKFKKELMRNRELATLPYPPIRNHELIIPRRARCKEKELLQLLFKYGIKTTNKISDVYLNNG